MSKKLIRLHTEDENSIFDCIFNSEIEISKQSEIAFHSISMATANKFLIIDGTNDILKFQIQVSRKATHDGNVVSAPIEINIPHDTYTKHNSTQLLEKLTNLMNQSLIIDNAKEHGSKISVNINSGSRLNVTFKYANQLNLSNSGVDQSHTESNGTMNVLTQGNPISNNGANTALFTNRLWSNIPFTGGCGNLKFKLSTYSAGGEDHAMTVGLTTNLDALQNNTVLTLADLVYSFRIPKQDQGGNTITLNDNISFALSGGKIETVRYPSGGGRFELASVPFDYLLEPEKPLYIVMFFHNNDSKLKIKNIKISPDPFTIPPNKLLDDSVELVELTAPPAPMGSRATVYNVIFPSVLVAEYFGYGDMNQNPFSNTFVEKSFISENHFNDVVSSDNYMIEILNLPLNSYDSFNPTNTGGGRKNILGIIPVSEKVIDDQTNLLQYEPNELSFISLNNEHDMRLRNIRARLIDFQHQSVFNSSFISLTIIIRDKLN